jgi:hypothetical protein
LLLACKNDEDEEQEEEVEFELFGLEASHCVVAGARVDEVTTNRDNASSSFAESELSILNAINATQLVQEAEACDTDALSTITKVFLFSRVVAGRAPVTAVVAVQAIGFASSGMIADSAAAAMMSSAATASDIASGSAVASLKSIGAVGFSAALPIASPG